MSKWPNPDLTYHANILRETVRSLKEYGWNDELTDILEVADSLIALAQPIEVKNNDNKGIN